MSKNLNQVQNLKCKNCENNSTNELTCTNDSTDLVKDHAQTENTSNTQSTSNQQQSSSNQNEQAKNLLVANYFEEQSSSLRSTSRLNLTPTYSCIIERLSRLYLSETLADVHFLIKNPLTSNIDKVPAHKLILSIGSKVFMVMFNGNFAESSREAAATTSNEIEIPDVELEPFLKMLKYLYTDELCVEPDSVMSTLYVAKKYAVECLEKECVDFLKKNLRTENAFMLLQQACLFDEYHLSEMCLSIIDKNTSESFGSEAFLDIDLNTLISVLRRDSLGIRGKYFFSRTFASNLILETHFLTQ
jgi:BTB/POZ domain-containing protein 1/2